MTPALAMARRVVVFNIAPPLTICVLSGVWVVDQAAYAYRLLREHYRAQHTDTQES